MRAGVSAPAIRRKTRVKPSRLHHDFETYSELDLTNVGASRYSRHTSTKVLMCGYAFDDAPVEQWVPAEGQRMPAELEDGILDPDIKNFAWNKPFEWNIWKNTLGLDTPHDNWRDPMVLGYYLSFPGKLDKVGPILKLPEEYLKKNGKALINWFCKPKPATKTRPAGQVHWYQKPEKWQEFLEYNEYDVRAERKIWRMCRKHDMPAHEWEMWAIDQAINEAGIPINMDMCHNVIKIRDRVIDSLRRELQEITGLENPNSQQQLLGWLEQEGYPFQDLKAAHIKRAAAKYDETEQPNQSPLYRRALALRQQISKTSTSKFDSIAAHTDEDGLLRNCFQFGGAQRTLRWAGRTLQPQNLKNPPKGLDGVDWEVLPSGYKRVVGGTQVTLARMLESQTPRAIQYVFEEPMDVLSGAVRPVIQAPDGYVFIDADLKAIENCVLGWMSNDKKILRVYEQGRDAYVDFATYLFKEPYQKLFEEYKAGDGYKRKISKPGVLGCGYMLSSGHEYVDHKTGEVEATGLMGYAQNMGVKLTQAQADLSVDVWRSTYKDTVEFWYDFLNAAIRCVNTRKRQTHSHFEFDIEGPFLRMRLPSGRYLHYYKPQMLDWLMPWGDYKLSLTYLGLNAKGQWDRLSTHPGKITENADQAVARDLLATGVRRAWKRGLPVFMHVHDQVVALVREDEAEQKLRILIECLTEPSKGHEGIPLAAEGHISKWFLKD